MSNYDKSYYDNNKEKMIERAKLYYQNNKEKVLERSKVYYQEIKKKYKNIIKNIGQNTAKNIWIKNSFYAYLKTVESIRLT